MTPRLPTIVSWIGLAAVIACRAPRESNLVALFALDGASLDIVDELRSEGKLPAFDRLIRSGTSGQMESLASRRLMNAMDGKVLAPIFDPEWPSANPPRYVEKDIAGAVGGGVSREGAEDVLERLRALGYIQ